MGEARRCYALREIGAVVQTGYNKLMSGLGIFSLIPKKGTDKKEQLPPGGVTAPPERAWETRVPAHSERDRQGGALRNGSAVLSSAPKEGERRPGSERKISDGNEAIFHIEVHLIKPNPFQPRREFSEINIEELARSIRDFGILQPLVVSKVVRETEGGTAVEYELIAGERRLLAARKLGLERVPVVVKRVDENRAKLEMSLIENLQRSDLSALEMARAYARLQDEFGLSQREVAARVGKSREVVANALRLLGLPQEIQMALGAGRINESQARALLAIGNAPEQERVFQEFLSRGGAVRARREKTPTPPADPEGAFWERRLEEKFGAPVKVVKKGNRGKIEMRFHSEEEWHGLVEKLVGEGLAE
ncbi:MAG: ParB/RepB/Spo0J family partition protein [Candidatus Jorgensenbacteria bacterium]